MKTIRSLTILTVVALTMMFSAQADEAENEKLAKEVQSTLSNFKSKDSTFEKALEKAQGYVVFPRIAIERRVYCDATRPGLGRHRKPRSIRNFRSREQRQLKHDRPNRKGRNVTKAPPAEERAAGQSDADTKVPERTVPAAAPSGQRNDGRARRACWQSPARLVYQTPLR